MKLYYQIHNTGIEIVRCMGNASNIVIPAAIGGVPVKQIAPYAFSDKKCGGETGLLSYDTEESFFLSDNSTAITGQCVKEIRLPGTVKSIGNYAFYGCKNLQTLEFSNRLAQIGSGVFTGCGGLAYLRIHMKEGKQSCAKEILGELWQRMDVTFLYKESQSKLVFPEHYEEAVENTPARILFTQHHGSGNNYRQCFYNKEMDYAKYDSLFSVAAAWDKPGVLADLALSRLKYPYELTKKSEEMYIALLKERYEEILVYLIEQEKLSDVRLFTDKTMWTQGMLDFGLEKASVLRKTEIAAYLMQEKQKLAPVSKKTFIL